MSSDDKPPAVTMDGVPFHFHGWRRDDITTVIDVSDFVAVKLKGIQCHTTQVGRDSPYARPTPELLSHPSLQEETFILARSLVGLPRGLEDDLFARL